ncbi:MAG: bifunctional diguanylate cyclase/phosphodiesterase [Burkholderiaceae bacterium]
MQAQHTAGEELEYLSRALRTLSGCNRALLRAEDESELLGEICRLIVDEAGYRFAWVGRAERDETKTVTPLAYAGLDQDYVDSLHLSWADNERGRGPSGTAIRTGKTSVSRDVQTDPNLAPWRAAAAQRGVASVLSLPLRVEGEIFGAIAIAAAEPDAFGDKELELLTQAAGDLAFGLETLRTKSRHAHAEQEVHRLNRALRARAAVNQALTQATREEGLLTEICRVVVDECGYRMAWIGYREQDEVHTYRPMAHAGYEEGFLARPFTWDKTAFGQRVSAVLDQGRPFVLRNIADSPDYPSHEEALQRGYGSLTLLPLAIEGRVVGALHIMAAEADAFDDKEVELLQATASDLGYGIGALRTRARAAEAEQTIKRMAYSDALTGLPNRVHLRERLEDAISAAKQERRPLGLLHVEVGRFRDINETLGYREGDRLLQEIADRLAKAAGEANTVARVGECEFAVLMPRGGAEQASQLAQKIVVAHYDPIEIAGLRLDARASIGIALYPGHGGDADALMRRASFAMDQAKRAGKEYALFEGGLDVDCAQRLVLMRDLRRAIENNELLLHYQPKLQVSTSKVVGAEARVRWQHPERGMLYPSEFIRLAESAGMITPLTHWVLDAALSQRYAWHEEGIERPVSVNLSARDLRDPKLLDHIKGAFTTWGASPDWIEFELGESALMEDPSGAMETLTRIKKLDTRLAIDDFGTGYSSLAYLQKLPVDEIKIDQSFVSQMLRNDDMAKIVHSTIELGHNLDLAVVAQGVEDQDTLTRLGVLGCDMAQGRGISRPIPAAQFREWEAHPTWH